MIEALSYLVIHTNNYAQWKEFAHSVLTLLPDDEHEVGEASYFYLRLDDKKHRFIIERCGGTPELIMGFETANAGALQQVESCITQAGFVTTWANEALCGQRHVAQMFYFTDPDGRRVEVCHGLETTSQPLPTARPMAGYRTGSLGMGHVALTCGNFQAMCHLYRDVLHFSRSDHGSEPFEVEFLHCNPRHHTLGLANGGGKPGIYHIMVVYNSFDDFGRAHDISLTNPDSIRVSLGRHINDFMTSFYVQSPDGWLIEQGFGGLLIGDNWQFKELPAGYSLWGHDRLWLPDDKRQLARELLSELSRCGQRAPNPLQYP